uniref:Envelope glycoprotein n=1 Tax=Amazona collaria TaxID=241587 RepID=A0A8B9J0L5_9PSIT
MALSGPLLIILGGNLLTLIMAHNCSQCVVTTRKGKVSSQTLVYHTIFDCKGQRLESCIFNQTQYALCKENDTVVCYDPKELPYKYWIEIKTNSDQGRLLGKSQITANLDNPMSIIFDACDAIDDDWYSNCGDMSWRTYYRECEKYVCIGSPMPSNCYQPHPSVVKSYHYCTGSGWGCACWSTAPSWKWPDHCTGSNLKAKIEKGHTSSPCEARTCNPVNITILNPHRLLFNSFYHEMEMGVKYEIPTVAKNLFINLAENIAKSLKVTNCYIYPGVWNRTKKGNRKQQWVLQTNIIGRSCWQNLENGKPVGNLECEGGYLWNETRNEWDKWGKPLEMADQFRNWTNGTTISDGWPTPDGHYWICGRLAYAYLPKNWTGSCVLGTIRPSFFLQRRYKRGLQIGQWKDNKCPPERIIAYYDPATWEEDRSWGYRTPIYMLNRIIKLQAVVEIVVNKTGDALGLTAKQNTKMRTALYQNRLALDYLLAQEGGVCGKFNLSNCCLEIDDEGKAVNELVREMKKIAHVPVQTWNGMNLGRIWDNFFNNDWFTRIGVIVLGIFTGLLIILCLIPCFIRLIHLVIQGMQISAVLIDPEEGKEKIHSLMIIKTKEDPELIPIKQVLTRLETKTRINAIK